MEEAMLMNTVTASEARIRFAELLSIVGFGKDRVLIEKHNRPVAALVPIEELVLMDDMIAVAREDQRFMARIAELAAARDHSAVISVLASPSDETVLTDESFKTVLERVRYPRPATGYLKDLMAADGD